MSPEKMPDFSTGSDMTSEEKFKKMLGETDPSALDAYNAGEAMGKSNQAVIENGEKSSVEARIEGIVNGAGEDVIREMGKMLSDKDKIEVRKIAADFLSEMDSDRSTTGNMWRTRINEIIREGGDLDKFADDMKKPLINTFKRDILEKIGKGEISQ